VRLGEAIELKGADPDEDTARIMEAIVELLPPEAREHHVPTPEELALTMPSSHKHDDAASADHEEARRPGTD
jgi:putative phosphoserine phosphatase/1-acylglycerol-3-phosphate O-acyltransferase